MLQFITPFILFAAHMGVASAQKPDAKFTPKVQPISLKGRPTTMSSTYGPPFTSDKAIDGDSRTFSHTAENKTSEPWWEVLLDDDYVVTAFEITNRPGFFGRLENVVVTVDGHKCGEKSVGPTKLKYGLRCHNGPIGRYVKIQLLPAPFRGVLTLNEVKLWGFKASWPNKFDQINLKKRPTKMSSIHLGHGGQLAIDGNINTFSHTLTSHSNKPYWEVDMGADYTIRRVEIKNRPDFFLRLKYIMITVDSLPCGPVVPNGVFDLVGISCPFRPRGRKLRIQLLDAPDRGILTLNEVNVWGHAQPLPEKSKEITLLGLKPQMSSIRPKSFVEYSIDRRLETYAQTANFSKQPWWSIVLNEDYVITSLYIATLPNSLYKPEKVLITVDGVECNDIIINPTVEFWSIRCPNSARGRYVKIQLLDAPNGILTLNEVRIWGESAKWVEKFDEINLSNRKVTTSKVLGPDFRGTLAIDGNMNTFFHTAGNHTNQPYWEIDMGADYTIRHVQINNRPGFLSCLQNIMITVDGLPCGPQIDNGAFDVVGISCPLRPRGRELRIQLLNAPVNGILTLNEVKAWGHTENLPGTFREIDLQCHKTSTSSVVAPELDESFLAVDGDKTTYAETVIGKSRYPFWAVDMGSTFTVAAVRILYQPHIWKNTANLVVYVDNKPCAGKVNFMSAYLGLRDLWIYCPLRPRGRSLRIEMQDATAKGVLTLNEVTAFGYQYGGERELRKY